MYNVSDEFKQAIKSNSRKFRWRGEIATVLGTVIPFDDNEIIKGSGYINRKCCSGSDIELGSVIAAECGITLLTNIDRYSLDGGTISFFFSVELMDGTYEEIPMGIFDISEANRNIKTIEIKGYDYMLRFEKSFDSTLTNGYPYDLLSFACDQCGVEMAQTQSDIESFSNGEFLLGIYSENDIETYRDLIYYTCQVLGAFAAIDRNGKLMIKQYSDTAVDTIAQDKRFSSSVSDFITRYTAVSSTNQITQIAEYTSLDPDDGLTMNLGINPLLQYGIDETRQLILSNILNQISIINYVPFDTTIIGNPAYDLGDVIALTGGQADGHIAAITSINTKINGKQTIKCVGKNPKLSEGKSKNDKNIAGLISQIQTKEFVFYSYTNSQVYKVKNADETIISIEFTSNTDTYAQFLAQILVNISCAECEESKEITLQNDESDPVSYIMNENIKQKAIAVITYKLNGEIIETYVPQETFDEGMHIIALYYPFSNVKAGSLYTFMVSMNISNGEAVIDDGQIQASVFGQGLLGAEAWDGTITIDEKFDGISTYKNRRASLSHFKDQTTVLPDYPSCGSFMDSYQIIQTNRSRVSFADMYDHVGTSELVRTFTLNTMELFRGIYDSRYVIINSNNEYALNGEYLYKGSSVEIDAGSLNMVEIDTDIFNTITSVEETKNG